MKQKPIPKKVVKGKKKLNERIFLLALSHFEMTIRPSIAP